MRKRVFQATGILILVCLIITGCSGLHERTTVKDHGNQTRNVIMIVGDGMGPEQVGLLLSYARQAPNTVIKEQKNGL